MLSIVYYINSKTDIAPARELIENVNKETTKAKIKANIVFVAENDGKAGNFITKNIRGYKFSEIRIKESKNLYRILYCVWKNNYLVLLHMFIKKGEKTPKKELEMAQEYFNDFITNNDYI